MHAIHIFKCITFYFISRKLLLLLYKMILLKYVIIYILLYCCSVFFLKAMSIFYILIICVKYSINFYSDLGGGGFWNINCSASWSVVRVRTPAVSLHHCVISCSSSLLSLFCSPPPSSADPTNDICIWGLIVREHHEEQRENCFSRSSN